MAFVQNCGLRLRPSLDTRDESLRLIARTMVPMTIGLSVVQINTLLDNVIAYAFVAYRAPGGARLRQRLYQFPLGVFAIALATALFPAMARDASEGDMGKLPARSPGDAARAVRGAPVHDRADSDPRAADAGAVRARGVPARRDRPSRRRW